MDWIMILCIINLILICVALPFIIIAIINVEALKRSTHRVQFVPAEQVGRDKEDGQDADVSKKLNEFYNKDDDGFIEYETF
jgi:hypothetical protein